jgi:pre-mRNA-processing factor 6
MFNGYSSNRGGGNGSGNGSGSSGRGSSGPSRGPVVPPKGYVAGLGRGAAGFTTQSDLGNIIGNAGNVGEDDTNASNSGSRASEQHAAKLQMQKMILLQQQQPPPPPPQQQQSSLSLSSSSYWGQAPKGYVAGAGRGASKMGDGGDAPESGAMPLGQQQQQQQQQKNQSTVIPGQFEDGKNDTSHSKYGGGGGMNNNSNTTTTTTNTNNEPPINDEDHEADLIWAAIDEQMQQRRKKRKLVSHGPDIEHQDDIQAQTRAQLSRDFSDYKAQLSTIKEEEWWNIPDVVGDHSARFKRQQEKLRDRDMYTPLSDTLLEQRSNSTKDGTNLNATVTHDSNSTSSSLLTNMSGIGAARGTVLGMSLDKMSDSVSGQTVVDPQGYLTSMSMSTIGGGLDNNNNNVGDVNKARLLLKSVRDTNPKHGPGWIASARVEEAAGKILRARKLIQEGCQICPTHTDVWLEAARLHPPMIAKTILATAVRRIPHSVPLFLKAAELEHNVDAKKAVLRKALEANPTSLTLWKTAIELEDESDNAKVLLGVAVEKIPTAVELWLALARLETYENAQRVLNKARRALPSEKSIWIAASKLEESNMGNSNATTTNNNNNNATKNNRIEIIMTKAFQSLAQHEAVVTRAQWLQEAEAAEDSGAPLTSASIVHHAIGLGVDVEDRQRTWSDDAKGALSRGKVVTARAILGHALQAYPTKKTLWMQAVELEKKYGTTESFDKVLQAASDRLPRVEVFWLFRAKEQWMGGNVDTAREILTNAFAANPDSESVWLAAAKLEWETGESERARVLLQRARDRAPTERVYMKSALLERELGHPKAALSLLDEGIGKYPKFAKLYMMGGQIYSNDFPNKMKTHLEKARKVYQEGIEQCPDNVILWILASRLEEQAHTFLSVVDNNNNNNVNNNHDENNSNNNSNNNSSNSKTAGGITVASAGAGVTKARSLLELARLKNPKNDVLWLEAIRLERRSNNIKLAETLMARAIQECPTSGLLLTESIVTSSRVEQKSKSADAIKRNPESPFIISAVATLFASDRKIDKARKWFDRAVQLNPDWGDSWGKYYSFELAYGTISHQSDVKERCIKAEPKHGELWQSIMKDMKNLHKSVGEGLELVAAEIKIRQQSK